MLAVWSYLLDGLFIGATRAREMRNTMLVNMLLIAPFAYGLQSFGNHGLWLTLLLFMLLRALTLGFVTWQLSKRGAWFSAPGQHQA